VHVKHDWLIDHGHSEALFAAAHQPKELHLLDIPGQHHADRIFSVADAGFDELLANWLERVAPSVTRCG